MDGPIRMTWRACLSHQACAFLAPFVGHVYTPWKRVPPSLAAASQCSASICFRCPGWARCRNRISDSEKIPSSDSSDVGRYPRDSESVVGRLLELEGSRLPCPAQRRPAPRREITQHAPSCLGEFRKIVKQGRPSRALRRVWWGSREGEWSCDEIRRGSMGPSRCLVRAVLFKQTRLNLPRGAPAEREVHGA